MACLNPAKSKGVTVLMSSLLFSHSVLSDSVTPWTAACQPSLSFTICQSLLKLMSVELVMPSNYLILRHLLLFLPPIFSSIRVFCNESALWIRWLKYWSFSVSNSLSGEYLGLISFRIDWLAWSLCCPRNSQESSSAPQFESINSLALKLFCGPDLTS